MEVPPLRPCYEWDDHRVRAINTPTLMRSTSACITLSITTTIVGETVPDVS
jgi:hypothetical protein